jgi:DNA-directed RNA polymerase alpha subunit
MNIQKVDGGVAGKVMGDQVITPKQNLADSASEIQQLLQILNQSYPADIPTDTQAEIEVAVKGINKNPQLKERVIGALKAGGIEAIKELADNIYVNVLIAAYDGWKNPQS